jgi:hypothetical protein
LTIILEDGSSKQFQLNELIALVEVNELFWKRFTGSLDLGYNFTRANENAQFTFSGNLKFVSEKWQIKSNIDVLNSSQDNVKDVKRTNAILETKRLLPKKMVFVNRCFLSIKHRAGTIRKDQPQFRFRQIHKKHE